VQPATKGAASKPMLPATVNTGRCMIGQLEGWAPGNATAKLNCATMPAVWWCGAVQARRLPKATASRQAALCAVQHGRCVVHRDTLAEQVRHSCAHAKKQTLLGRLMVVQASLTTAPRPRALHCLGKFLSGSLTAPQGEDSADER
jgi:hypothetical protein